MTTLFSQLGPGGLKWLLAEQEDPTRREERRDVYGRRTSVMADTYQDLVYFRIVEVFKKLNTHQELGKHLEAGTNVMSQVVRDLAFVYRRQPLRRLEIDGALGEALNARLARGIRESRIGSRAKLWGQYAFAMNVIWVVPNVWRTSRGLKLDFTMVLPDRCDRIHGANIRDTQILLWERDRRDQDGDEARYNSTPRHGYVLVDAEAYYWLDPSFGVEFVVPHRMGVCPAVEFRVSEPPPRDFWDLGRGSKMVYATLESARAGAMGAWVRAIQNRKLVSLFGDVKKIDRDQIATPETGVGGQTDGGDSIDFEVHDFETAVDGFSKEQAWYARAVFESFGAASVFDDDPAERAAARRELREDQRAVVIPSEVELMESSHRTMAAFGHPDSIDPELIAEHYQPRWAPMSGIDDPLKQTQVWEARIKLGVGDQAAAALEMHPSLGTLEAAHAFVLANLERRAEVDLHYARHNLSPIVGAGVESIPQIQGAIGGRLGAATTPDQDQQP